MPIQIDAKSIVDLVAKEGWHLTKDKTTNTPLIEAEGETYPFCHPVLIHLKKYRLEQNPELKYQHMKAAHDYLWPDTVWHYWTERRFKTHCEDWKLVTWAGGAATGKAQPLNALIRTPSGWTTMGELKEGSIICDTEGGAQYVQKIHPQGIQDIYKVETNDGGVAECTLDHLWVVKDDSVVIGQTWKTLSLKQILNTLHNTQYYIPVYTPLKREQQNRRIVKIEKVRQDYAQCITVSSSNNLYITNDYIVTHNSFDAAKIACEFWLADPRNRAVIVASSSLESLNARIWGYCTRFMHEMQVPLPFNYRRGAPPKILYEARDTIHGMFAVAAKRGDDDAAISNWIGRHPNKGLLLVLDEGTELPMAILNALPNLEAGQDNFQCIVIGNSLSHYDLHGSLSTPKHGWKSIDPETHTKWETTQKKGLCLFFSCYESPAIGEPDKERKKKLSKFLITKEEIDSKIKVYGSSSDSFYRFVLGFWRSEGTEDTVLSKVFLNEFHIREKAEWSGIHELSMVAGLDPAFSTGGDSCILRLGILGLDVNGNLLLDFRGDELLFKIEILALSDVSIETQIANQVIAILSSYRCQIGNMAVDATGQGRALAEVIRLQARTLKAPLKIWSTKLGNMQKNSFDVVLKSTLELWTDVRDFISTDQIRGLDNESINQFASRLIEIKGAKQTLESKADYKKRMGAISPRLAHSPDEADSVALCVQAAKICFGFTPGVTHQEKKIESFEMEKWYAQLHARAIEEKASTVCAPQATFSNPNFAPINMFQGFKRD